MTPVDEYIHSLLNRRLDDRIREICEKAFTTDPDDREIAVIKQELLCLMHQKINRMRRLGVTELEESLVELHRA